LIHAAKRPGWCAQKTKMGALYDAKAAERVVDSFFINRFHDLMHPTVAEETPLSDNNQHVAVDVMNSTGRGTFGQLRHVPDSESILLSWSTKTNQEHLQLPQSLMQYVVNEFGDTVTICTEFCRDDLTFRCHPKYQSYLAKYDWMKVQFDTGIFPCQLCLVIVHARRAESEFHLVVQSTTEQRTSSDSNGSVLFTEWQWSQDYYTILPEHIVSRCFCITNKHDNTRILETLPYEEWANQFTH